MRRVLLLYNPAAGTRRLLRLGQVETAQLELAAAGVEAAIEPTWHPGSAPEQVRDALANGFDTILACGGDGTINETLQGIVGTQAVLGVIPLGTGNGLAADLGIPHDPAAAAQLALQSIPRRVAVARIRSQRDDGATNERYFLTAAGVGGDAEMFYRLALDLKARRGMSAYYLQAWKTWATYGYPRFHLELRSPTGEKQQMIATQVLAIRITRFGGLLGKLAPGAALHRPDLQLVIAQTGRRWPLLRYMIRTVLQRQWRVPGVELTNASALRCQPLETGGATRIHAQADGELVGKLPVEIAMTDQFVRLLVPPGRKEFEANG